MSDFFVRELMKPLMTWMMAALLAGGTIVDAQAQTPNLAEQGARLDSVLAAR